MLFSTAAVLLGKGDLFQRGGGAGGKTFVVFRQMQRIGLRHGIEQHKTIRPTEGRLKRIRVGKAVAPGQQAVQRLRVFAFKPAETAFAQIRQFDKRQSRLPRVFEQQSRRCRGSRCRAGKRRIKLYAAPRQLCAEICRRRAAFFRERRIAPPLQAAERVEHGFAVAHQINFQIRHPSKSLKNRGGIIHEAGRLKK